MTPHEPLLPFDAWARLHGMIAVGSSLVFSARKEDQTYLFFVNMTVPLRVPDGVDIESWMRSTWLTAAETERERCRADGWVCESPTYAAPNPPNIATYQARGDIEKGEPVVVNEDGEVSAVGPAYVDAMNAALPDVLADVVSRVQKLPNPFLSFRRSGTLPERAPIPEDDGEP